MIRHVAAGILAVLLLPTTAFAQGIPATPTTGACLADMYAAFGREHRLSRAVLFGRPKAADAPVSSVYHDARGDAWAKTGTNTWKSPADGREGTAWSNAQMDAESEKDLLCDGNADVLAQSCVRLPRRGIFETTKTPTSDLIQPVTQTIRALQCRLRAVCALASQSPDRAAGERITIELDGCLPMTYPVMEGCRNVTPTIFDVMPGNCAEARRELVRREMQLLTLTMSYDASYRSLAQFAGMFQEFLVQFRFPLIEPLWQTVRTLGGLNGIPCFQAECNE